MNFVILTIYLKKKNVYLSPFILLTKETSLTFGLFLKTRFLINWPHEQLLMSFLKAPAPASWSTGDAVWELHLQRLWRRARRGVSLCDTRSLQRVDAPQIRRSECVLLQIARSVQSAELLLQSADCNDGEPSKWPRWLHQSASTLSSGIYRAAALNSSGCCHCYAADCPITADTPTLSFIHLFIHYWPDGHHKLLALFTCLHYIRLKIHFQLASSAAAFKRPSSHNRAEGPKAPPHSGAPLFVGIFIFFLNRTK